MTPGCIRWVCRSRAITSLTASAKTVFPRRRSATRSSAWSGRIPFAVAAARRGDNLLVQNHHRAMVDWYLHSMEPNLGHWTSHGDGGDGGPAVWTAAMWHYFYPDDPKTGFLWQTVLNAGGKKALAR